MVAGEHLAKVAVVIPCYESAGYLREAVDSVRGQTLGDWRLVVVDDGSTDDPHRVMTDVLRADQRVDLVRQQRRGVAAARNAGAKRVAPSHYILFLDADDVLEPTMLERLVDWLDDHPSAGAAYCRPSFINELGDVVTMDWAPRLEPGRFGVRVVPDERPVTPFVSVFCLAGIIPSLTLLRRQTFDEAGGWDETFGQHYEDTLFFLELVLRSELHHLPEQLVRHRRHPGQSTADISKFARQQRKLYERFRDMSRFTPSEAMVVSEAWRFRERRVIPRRSLRGAKRSLRSGAPLTAARKLGGGVRIAAGSFVLGPGRVRYSATPSTAVSSSDREPGIYPLAGSDPTTPQGSKPSS